MNQSITNHDAVHSSIFNGRVTLAVLVYWVLASLLLVFFLGDALNKVLDVIFHLNFSVSVFFRGIGLLIILGIYPMMIRRIYVFVYAIVALLFFTFLIGMTWYLFKTGDSLMILLFKNAVIFIKYCYAFLLFPSVHYLYTSNKELFFRLVKYLP